MSGSPGGRKLIEWDPQPGPSRLRPQTPSDHGSTDSGSVEEVTRVKEPGDIENALVEHDRAAKDIVDLKNLPEGRPPPPENMIVHEDEMLVWNGEEWATVEVMEGARMVQPMIPPGIEAEMGQYIMTDGVRAFVVPMDANEAAVLAEGTERGLWIYQIAEHDGVAVAIGTWPDDYVTSALS